MQDDVRHDPEGHPAHTGDTSSSMPGCRWNLKDPRSCLEPDSCGCYVDPCVYFGVSPENCCDDADILCGA